MWIYNILDWQKSSDSLVTSFATMPPETLICILLFLFSFFLLSDIHVWSVARSQNLKSCLRHWQNRWYLIIMQESYYFHLMKLIQPCGFFDILILSARLKVFESFYKQDAYPNWVMWQNEAKLCFLSVRLGRPETVYKFDYKKTFKFKRIYAIIVLFIIYAENLKILALVLFS